MCYEGFTQTHSGLEDDFFAIIRIFEFIFQIMTLPANKSGTHKNVFLMKIKLIYLLPTTSQSTKPDL